jgi:hypothetical protein
LIGFAEQLFVFRRRWSHCFPPARPCGRLLTGFDWFPQASSNVIPRLDRGTQYSRRWSRVVCPSDYFLRYGVLRCQNSKAHQDCALLMLHSLKRKAPLGPGSRDGLSVHTVRDDSWRNAGKLCRETSCPPWQALFGFREHVRVRARSRAGATLIALLALPRRGSDAGTFTGCLPSERPRGGLARARAGVQRASGNCRERNKRKHGPLRFAPYLYFIGAPLSGPSGGDCTLPRSVFLWVEQLYSDLPVLAPFSIPGVRRFRIAA